MGDQYKVVPEALRRAQQSIEATAQRWNEMATHTLPGWKLSEGDLGLIGRMAGIVEEYNSAVDQITNKVQQGQSSLEHAGTALDDVARSYEEQDEEYYVKFGWIERDLDDVARPPQ